MIQVKIFEESSEWKLRDSMNKFLASLTLRNTPIAIHYSHAISSAISNFNNIEIQRSFSAMVQFQSDTPIA